MLYVKNTSNCIPLSVDYRQDIENLKSEVNKYKVENFLRYENYTNYIDIGNLAGGRIHNIGGNKSGHIVTIYFQINGITQKCEDIEIFRFKDRYKSKYGPCNYTVYPAFIGREDNIAYIGHFANSKFTMSIYGKGSISTSNTAVVLCTATYLTYE